VVAAARQHRAAIDLTGALVLHEEPRQAGAERERVRYDRPVRDQRVGVDERRAPQIKPDRPAQMVDRLESERVDVKRRVGEQLELLPAP
jgi:hypothetical protein